MAGAGLLGAVHADFFEVDLELELEVALGGAGPDGAGGGGQRLQQALEHLAVEGGGGDVRLAQPGHLVEAAAEPAAFLLNDVAVHLRIGSDTHGSTSSTGV